MTTLKNGCVRDFVGGEGRVRKFLESPKRRRGQALQAGQLNLPGIFCSKAPLQGICEWSKEYLNVIENVTESPTKMVKVPIVTKI